MSGLFGALSTTSSALEAQRRGMEVAGQNIANVNTEGYTRRTLVLAERPALEPGEAGRGVQVSQVRAVRDVFLNARIGQEQQQLSRDVVVAEALSVVEASLGSPGASVDGQLSAWFNTFGALAEDPASLTLRDAVVRESERLAIAFRDMAGRFTRATADADAGVRGAVEQVNRLAADVAAINERIGSAQGADAESLLDRRAVLLQSLADLTDVNVSDASGYMTVTTAAGHTLISGAQVVGLTVEDAPGSGLARVISDGIDITTAITGGQLGGWLHVRDTQLPAYTALLDDMAWTMAAEVNARHQTGLDADGNPGGAVFDAGATVTGAAAAFTVSADILADPRRVVAASASVSNGAARDLAALRDARVGGASVTLNDAWGQLVYRVGGDTASAQRVQQGRQQVMDQLSRLREAASGVSLDEEAASLMRYQRAYEANARYFTTINDVLEVLMGLGRR
jgi:flagellar hook-associated protein 1 FlgK